MWPVFTKIKIEFGRNPSLYFKLLNIQTYRRPYYGLMYASGAKTHEDDFR